MHYAEVMRNKCSERGFTYYSHNRYNSRKYTVEIVEIVSKLIFQYWNV
jgi:hypothetical protein